MLLNVRVHARLSPARGSGVNLSLRASLSYIKSLRNKSGIPPYRNVRPDADGMKYVSSSYETLKFDSVNHALFPESVQVSSLIYGPNKFTADIWSRIPVVQLSVVTLDTRESYTYQQIRPFHCYLHLDNQLNASRAQPTIYSHSQIVEKTCLGPNSGPQQI
ncbi:hypothetical protein VNO77_37627 [Canavalia gladiata]|uniref:Uncharacterized protein n=1 Tax=Canavalia gladiata TaxID=3824 RepID=A0AAN9PUV7_CANGL